MNTKFLVNLNSSILLLHVLKRIRKDLHQSKAMKVRKHKGEGRVKLITQKVAARVPR
jgi:hypothetical protein